VVLGLGPKERSDCIGKALRRHQSREMAAPNKRPKTKTKKE